MRPLHNVASEDKTRQKPADSGVSVPPHFGYSVPFFMGVTGVTEHIESVFNAVLPSTVIIPSG